MARLDPTGISRILSYIKNWVTTALSGKANSSHSHTKSQITDFPTIPSSTSQLTNDSGYITSSGSCNYANSAGAVAWDNVSGKPSTFTPSSHTHNYAGSSNVGGAASSTLKLETYKQGSTTETYGANYPIFAQWVDNNNVALKCTNYTVWVDKANSVAWGSVTGKPSFATVATSGSYNDLSNKPSIPSIDLRPQASADANTVSDGVSITHYGSNGPSTSLGATANDGALFQQCWSSAWKVQIAADYRNGNLFTRGKNNGTWQPWRAVAYHGDNVSKFTNDSGFITRCINPSSGNYTEGIRFNKSTNGWATITIGTASGTTNGPMNGTGWGIFCDTADNFIINNFDSGTANAALYCSDKNTYISNLYISGGYKIYVD